jgi:hypothetical protein
MNALLTLAEFIMEPPMTPESSANDGDVSAW